MNYRLLGSKLISDGLYVNDYGAKNLEAMNTIPTDTLCMCSTCVIPGGITYMWNEEAWIPHVAKQV